MKIIIESPQFTVNEQLQEYTIKKAGKLSHIDERLIKCEITLKLNNSDTDDNKICEIKVSGDQKNLFASGRNQTFEGAITEVIHAIEKQLKKEKVKARRDGRKIEIGSEANEEETGV